MTSGPQKSPLCSQCANHGVLSFSSTKCSSRPASVLWPNEMSVRKQSSSCLFAAVYNHVGCPAAGPAAFRHLVSQKKGSRVTKYRGAFQPWCLVRVTRRFPGWWWASADTCCQSRTQHSSAGEAPSLPRDSWRGASDSDCQCGMERGKYHP